MFPPTAGAAPTSPNLPAVPGLPDLRADPEVSRLDLHCRHVDSGGLQGLPTQKAILRGILARFTVIKELNTNPLKFVSLLVIRC